MKHKCSNERFFSQVLHWLWRTCKLFLSASNIIWIWSFSSGYVIHIRTQKWKCNHVKYWYFKNTYSNNFIAVLLQTVVHTVDSKVFKIVYVDMAYESFTLIFAAGALGEQKIWETKSLQFNLHSWPSRKLWHVSVLLLPVSWCICKGS